MAFIESVGNDARAGVDPIDEVPTDAAGYQAVYPPNVQFDEQADRQFRELMVEAKIPRYIGDRLLAMSLNAKPRSPEEAELAAVQNEARVLKALGGEEAAKASFENAGRLFDHLPADKRARLAELIQPFESDEWLIRSLVNWGNARATKPEGK